MKSIPYDDDCDQLNACELLPLTRDSCVCRSMKMNRKKRKECQGKRVRISVSSPKGLKVGQIYDLDSSFR